MKTCKKCLKSRPLSEYNKNHIMPDGLQTICRACDNKKCKGHYQLNRQSYIERRKKRCAEIKEWFVELKKQKSCEECGDDRWYVLDFHHTGRKEGNVSTLVAKGCSKERILAEIAKCVTLCSNCHREAHQA